MEVQLVLYHAHASILYYIHTQSHTVTITLLEVGYLFIFNTLEYNTVVTMKTFDLLC